MTPDILSSAFLFEAILVSLALALLSCWIGIYLAVRWGLIDQPGSAPHKQHTSPTPLAGGLALFAAVILSTLFAGLLDLPEVWGTFLAGSVVFAFGIWDDIKTIPPLIKLIGQLIAAIILIRLGIFIRIFESPEFFLYLNSPIDIYLDWLLTVFWMVGITNAFNFVDSMDGLAVGLGGTAASFFMLVTLDARQFTLSAFSAVIIGICIGLYFFNSPPARLFLGDSGSQTLGFILAVLAITYRPLGANQSSSYVVPIMILGVPIFDMALVVVSRLRRKKPVYTAARDHSYHRLLFLGFGPNRAVLIMQVTSLTLGCLAVVVLNQPPLITNIVFIIVVLLSLFALLLFDSKQRWS
jgi:UDP-GlcNAc:undecaprenyl-phosphate GlcNAc-1-phosphate transferase